LAPGASGADCRLIAVSSNGWHAGVYLPAAAFPADGPVRGAFPAARWFAVGWGDARAYPGSLNPFNGAAAILWPTRSVLHIAGLSADPRRAYRQDYVDVAVSAAGYRGLVAALESELALDEADRPIRVADGLDPRGSGFYAARSRYHLFNTCNVWLAARLKESGLPTGWPGGRLLPGGLMRSLARRAPDACPAPVAP